MSALDDELVEAVCDEVWAEVWADDGWGWHGFTEADRATRRRLIAAVLSVPALRDALARDAQVREIVDAAERLRAGGVSWEGISAAQDAYKRIVAIHLGQSTEPTT